MLQLFFKIASFLMAGAIAPAFFIYPVSAQILRNITQNGDIITNSEGWKLPDISKLTIENKRTKFRQNKNSPKIYETTYETNDFEFPDIDFDGNIKFDRKIVIHELTVFDINKRVFCYRMLACATEVGVVWYITYYDLNGDDIFESWDIAQDLRKPLIIPQWAVKK